MDEPIGRADIDEDPERRDAGNGAVQHLPLLEVGRRLLLPPGTQLLCRGLLRQDQSVAALVRLDNLQRKPLADVVAKRVGDRGALGPTQLAHRSELRERHEAPEPKVDHEAAAVRFHDLRLNDLAALREFAHAGPLPPTPRAARGEDHAAIRTFRLDHRRDNSVADCDIRSFSARLAKRKHARGAAAEIDERLIAAH